MRSFNVPVIQILSQLHGRCMISSKYSIEWLTLGSVVYLLGLQTVFLLPSYCIGLFCPDPCIAHVELLSVAPSV